MLAAADPSGITAVDWTAIGTIALALATFAAVMTTIIATSQDRKKFEQQILRSDLRELTAEAWAVQVMLSDYVTRTPHVRQLVALVTNYGTRTIARVRLRFVLADGSMVRPGEVRSISRDPQSRSPGMFSSDNDAIRPTGVLPAGAGLRFTSDELAGEVESDAGVMVRWLDHAGHNWQHDYGSGIVHELSQAEAAEW